MQTSNPAIAHMQLLSRQLDQLYREMKDERKTIAQWEENREFSILGVLELFASDIQGYVEQIAINHTTIDNVQALEHLRQLNTFGIDYFTAWYFENWPTYPQTKQYVEQLDHLRLLLIENLDVRVAIAA